MTTSGSGSNSFEVVCTSRSRSLGVNGRTRMRWKICFLSVPILRTICFLFDNAISTTLRPVQWKSVNFVFSPGDLLKVERHRRIRVPWICKISLFGCKRLCVWCKFAFLRTWWKIFSVCSRTSWEISGGGKDSFFSEKRPFSNQAHCKGIVRGTLDQVCTQWLCSRMRCFFRHHCWHTCAISIDLRLLLFCALSSMARHVLSLECQPFARV